MTDKEKLEAKTLRLMVNKLGQLALIQQKAIEEFNGRLESLGKAVEGIQANIVSASVVPRTRGRFTGGSNN